MESRHPRRAPGMNLLALALIAGLLIWAKLRLVTDFPRTVIADPEIAETDSGDDPSADPETRRDSSEPESP